MDNENQPEEAMEYDRELIIANALQILGITEAEYKHLLKEREKAAIEKWGKFTREILGDDYDPTVSSGQNPQDN